MRTPPRSWLGRLWKADAFSPKDFIRRAVFLAVAYGVAELAGLREFTSFLSGTAPPAAVSDATGAFFGCLFMVLYFAWVLLVPILLIAAALGGLWRWRRSGSRFAFLSVGRWR